MINEITNTVVKKVRKGVWRMPRLTGAPKVRDRKERPRAKLVIGAKS